MSMIFSWLKILIALLKISMNNPQSSGSTSSHALEDCPCHGQLWQNWFKWLHKMAKQRIFDENLRLEVENCVLDKLVKHCKQLCGNSASLVKLKISHWREDCLRKILGNSSTLYQYARDKPLYKEAMTLLKGKKKDGFNGQHLVDTLTTNHPQIDRLAIFDTVLTIKAYYLLSYQYSRKMVEENLHTDLPAVPPSCIAQIVQMILKKCNFVLFPVYLLTPFEENEGDEKETRITEGNHPHPPSLGPEQTFNEQRKEIVKTAVLQYLFGQAIAVETELLPKVLPTLQQVSLTPMSKQLLWLFYYHDQTAKEIVKSDFGKRYKLTEKQVFTQCGQALKKIREALKKENWLD